MRPRPTTAPAKTVPPSACQYPRGNGSKCGAPPAGHCDLCDENVCEKHAAQHFHVRLFKEKSA